MQQKAHGTDVGVAEKIISAELLSQHICSLASDEFLGRCPGTKGERRTLEYFDEIFSRIESSTGASFSRHKQKVPAIEVLSVPKVSVTANGTPWELAAPSQYVAGSRRLQPNVQIEAADLVFAGYGIVAAEYGWDDFKDVDVEGKTIVVLCGDPILTKADNPAEIDTGMFRGKELTYYGRWTYKYEMAARRKAAGVLIIHEADRAGYDWDVVTHSFGHADFELKSIKPEDVAPMEGWLSLAAGKELLSKCGLDYEALKKKAMQKNFRPIEMKAKLTANVASTFRDVETYNYVAVLEGTDPACRNESVLFSAHWDHFGDTADGIISGAVDNASGCAAVLALAEAFASLEQRPRRSIVFFLPTLEEQGLLGSKYFVQQPTLPIADTLAVLNLEMLNPWGLSKSISSVCKGHTSLDQLLDSAAARCGREIVSDPQPDKGYLYRSDHLPFMQSGVPALALFFPCMDHMEKRQHYIANDYHKPTDKPKADWNLEGAAADTVMFFEVGANLLETGYRATWSEMSEFRKATSDTP